MDLDSNPHPHTGEPAMTALLLAADLVAVALLVFGLFLPRHGRRDLVAAYLGINIGVFAISAVLASATTVGVGLGLGLFGVLSIIRLRSDELTQTEIAYYFGSLTLGLLAGLAMADPVLIGVFMALVLVALFVGDHPRVGGRSVRQALVLDRAHTDRAALRAHIERVLGSEVHDITVIKTDLVNDTTLVSVRHTPQAIAMSPVATREVAP